MDYIICRRAYLKAIGDCKVIAGDNVAKQHRLLVCWMTLETRKRKITKTEPRIKWWKLKNEDCCEEFREEMIGLWAVRKSYRMTGQLRQT